MTVKIPQEVVDKDNELEARAGRSAEALAKHRWQQTLDPKGPQHSFSAYAKAVARSRPTITGYAKGYALFMGCRSDLHPPSIADCIAKANQSTEAQEFTEAIAEGARLPVKRVAHPEQRDVRAVIVAQAKDRAERLGTDPVDEARDIAKRQRQTREMESRRKTERATKHTQRYGEMEDALFKAKRALLAAITVAEGVDFDAEETDLIRHSLADVQAVLHLLDARMAGTPDIDWDDELARLSEGT